MQTILSLSIQLSDFKISVSELFLLILKANLLDSKQRLQTQMPQVPAGEIREPPIGVGTLSRLSSCPVYRRQMPAVVWEWQQVNVQYY